MSCFWTNLVGCRQACPEPEEVVGRIVNYSRSAVATFDGKPKYLVVGNPATLHYNEDDGVWEGADEVTTLRVTRIIYANSDPGDTQNCGGDPEQLIPGSLGVPAWEDLPAGMYQYMVTVDIDIELDTEVGWFIDPGEDPDNGPSRDELTTLLGVPVAEGTIVIFAIDDFTGKQYAGGFAFTSCI
jgi:hypothetical protein